MRPRRKKAAGSLAAVAKAASMKAERAAIEQTLRQVHWNRRKAAQILGVSYKTLLNKIKECGISRACTAIRLEFRSRSISVPSSGYRSFQRTLFPRSRRTCCSSASSRRFPNVRAISPRGIRLAQPRRECCTLLTIAVESRMANT